MNKVFLEQMQTISAQGNEGSNIASTFAKRCKVPNKPKINPRGDVR
jgi:hypothetical protein